MSVAMPAALAKARSLLDYAERRGEGIEGYSVVLDDQEALDLLAWWRTQYAVPAFERDARKALKARDPWPVLSAFKLMGLPIARRSSLQ